MTLHSEAEERYIRAQGRSGLKVGDWVKVLRKAKSEARGWGNSWIPEMDDFVGTVQQIKSVGFSECSADAGLYFVGGHESKLDFGFPFFVLKKVRKPRGR